jgi:Protein of unknown function (DUF3184).
VPVWKSWAVLASIWTDPEYVGYRFRRRFGRLIGRPAGQAGSAAAARLAKDAEPAGDLTSLDVDLVYLWVSGQDPKHREKRNYWLQQYGLPPKVFNPDVRYVEDDELRYSLRSAEQFVPWVRRIFIVTDGQAPAWLDRNHPKWRSSDQTRHHPEPGLAAHLQLGVHRSAPAEHPRAFGAFSLQQRRLLLRPAVPEGGFLREGSRAPAACG